LELGHWWFVGLRHADVRQTEDWIDAIIPMIALAAKPLHRASYDLLAGEGVRLLGTIEMADFDRDLRARLSGELLDGLGDRHLEGGFAFDLQHNVAGHDAAFQRGRAVHWRDDHKVIVDDVHLTTDA